MAAAVPALETGKSWSSATLEKAGQYGWPRRIKLVGAGVKSTYLAVAKIKRLPVEAMIMPGTMNRQNLFGALPKGKRILPMMSRSWPKKMTRLSGTRFWRMSVAGPATKQTKRRGLETSPGQRPRLGDEEEVPLT